MKKIFILLLFIATTLLNCVYTKAANTNTKNVVVWNDLVIGSATTSNIIITKVMFYDDRTEVNARVKMKRGSKFGIRKDTYLLAGGRQYNIKDATHIKLGDYMQIPDSGSIDLTMTFEPLPLHCKTLSFIEPLGWIIRNVHGLDSNKEDITDTYWRNDATGDFLIGFAKGHVVYDSKVWDIIGLHENNDKYEFTINDGSETLVIKLGKTKIIDPLAAHNTKHLRTITIGKGKAMQCSMITITKLPDYPVKDTRKGFKDNGYRIGDSVTISGWLKDIPAEYTEHGGREFEVYCDGTFLFGNGTSYKTAIDSLGRFRITIPVPNSISAGLDTKRLGISTVFEPGEKYFFVYDFSTGHKLFMGNNVRLQNEMLMHRVSHEREYYFGEKENGNIDATGFLAKTDSLRAKQNEDLKKLIEKSPNLSQRYIDYASNVHKTRQGKSLMQAMYYFCDNGLPLAYEHFVNEKMWKEIPQPYTLYDLSLFISDFICYHTIIKERNSADNDQSSVNAQLDNSASTYRYHNLKNTLENLGTDDSLLSVCLAQSIYSYIEQERVPLDSLAVEYAKENIKQPYFLKGVLDVHEKYVAIQNRDISASPCLKNDSIIAGLTDGEDILRRLTEPYKGKVVMIDVWGTWCSPCKRALAKSHELYKRLEQYDIVYMYLANRSDKDAWMNVIKEYDVLGDDVVHFNLPREQQQELEKVLKLTGYPCYRFIDTDGTLLDHAKFPLDVDYLENLLKARK